MLAVSCEAGIITEVFLTMHLIISQCGQSSYLEARVFIVISIVKLVEKGEDRNSTLDSCTVGKLNDLFILAFGLRNQRVSSLAWTLLMSSCMFTQLYCLHLVTNSI